MNKMWIKLTTTDGINHLANGNAIMDVTYNEETDLTVITFIRTAYSSLYVRGDITKKFILAVMSSKEQIHNLGD